jgi:hypothetical protein
LHALRREGFDAPCADFAVTALAKSRGKHNGSWNSFSLRLFQYITRSIGADRHDQAIYTRWQVHYAGKALVAVDVGVPRVDPEYLACEPAIAKIGDDVGASPAAL